MPRMVGALVCRHRLTLTIISRVGMYQIKRGTAGILLIPLGAATPFTSASIW